MEEKKELTPEQNAYLSGDYNPWGENVEELITEWEHEMQIAFMHNFYDVRLKNGEPKIHFNILRTLNKIRKLGYYRYDIPGGSSVYVYIHDNKIRQVDAKTIRDAMTMYIKKLPPITKETIGEVITREEVTSYMLENAFISGACSYTLSDQNLERLLPYDKNGDVAEIKILKDTKHTKYIFFRDSVVAIHDKPVDLDFGQKAIVEICDYKDMKGGCIWENSIIDRDFHYTTDVGDFNMFCMLISDMNDDRFKSLRSILGYLLHDNYETDLRAVIFTDVNKDNLVNAAGRTGKGLLATALSHVLNRDIDRDCKMLNVPGKDFCATNPKRYSAGDISSQLVHIEDLNSKFNFEELYGDITDRAPFQKHFQNPVYRKIKLMLSMNQALALKGSTQKGRACVFELSNFFSDQKRPGEYFGSLHGMRERRFWEGSWDDHEWDMFYSFMVDCCKEYMTNGLTIAKDINFTERAIRKQIGDNLWYFLGEEDRFGGIKGVRKKINKATLFSDYAQKYTGEFHLQKYFSEAVTNYLISMSIPSISYRDGKDWFIIYPNQEDLSKSESSIQIIVKSPNNIIAPPTISSI